MKTSCASRMIEDVLHADGCNPCLRPHVLPMSPLIPSVANTDRNEAKSLNRLIPFFRCVLTTRFGSEIASPNEADLQRALDEVLIEKTPGMTEADYAEYPSSWLTLTFESGTKYQVDVYRKGRVLFSSYADESDVDPGEEYVLAKLPAEEIRELWDWLCDGDVERVRSLPWQTA